MECNLELLEFSMNQSESITQSDDQKYTNYVDPSTIMINHYRNHASFDSFGKCIQKIEQWLSTSYPKNDNKPLVISTEPSSGQIPMLVKWMSANQEIKNIKKEKNLVVIHFASMGGNNTNYFYAIYRFLNKLRESLKIKQKVELLEEKIRKYFAYWLDVCGSELEKQQITNETTNIYEKIILVIQGIENFKDPETGKESNIAFWLPRCFPSNIKVIITADSNSDALNHFTRIGSEIISIQSNTQFEDYIQQRTSQLQSALDPSFHQQLKSIFYKLMNKPSIKKNMTLFTEAFISAVLVESNGNDLATTNFLKKTITQKLNLKKLSSIQSLEEFYGLIINFWVDQFTFKLKDLLLGLILNQKGLTYGQLNLLCNIEPSGWRYFKSIFRFSLIEYKDLFMIQQPIFKSTVIRIFSVKQDGVRQIHQKIADVLEQTPNSIRKLEEETYHLYVSKCYFKLKEKISNIQNFLLLFNPANKYDFSRYWQKLEEKGFDPVIQYNKAIEGFSMHYHPTQESIFRIIVQISRFLKEFCDFQTYFTPNFRHPPIEGSVIEMDKIGLLKELEKLEIFVDSSCNKEEKVLSHPSLMEQIKEVRSKYFPAETAQKKQEPEKVVEAEKSAGKSYKEQEKKSSFLVTPILSYIQQLNVDVPKNRETFKTYYMNLLKDFMEKKESNENKDEGKFYLDENEIDDEEDIKNGKKEKQPEFKLMRLKENFSTIEVKPSLYYYKRWIWIQFPWACISLHNNYSQTPQLCLTSATEYMSVESEAEFTRQALKIAIEAKERKKLMFTQKLDHQDQSKKIYSSTRSQFRSESMDVKLKTVSGTSVFSAIKNINLNLQSLIKQLQQKRSKYLDKTEHLRRQQSYESSAFMTQARQREVDFIQKRKVFTINNSNPSAKSQLLPKIKSDIKDHTLYQLNYLKSHIQQKKKSINQIIYQNNKLQKIYKQLKIKEWQSIELTNIETKKSKNFEELQRKKETTIIEFCKSLLQKQRLKIILKLCSENKTKNEEYLTSLNYLLQNLKKMISWQKGDMKKLQTGLMEIQTLNQLTKEASREKEHNEQILNSEIKMALEAKSKIESQITQMSMVINEEVYLTKSKFEDNLSGDRLKNEQKNKQLLLQRNAKIIEDQLQVMQKNYNQIVSILKLKDFNFRESERYQELMKEKERNKELNLILFERTNKLEELRLESEKKKKSIKNQASAQSPVVSKERRSENKQIAQLNEICLKYKIGFENLGLRLKLKNKSRESILQEITTRLSKFREQNEEEYLLMITTNRDTEVFGKGSS